MRVDQCLTHPQLDSLLVLRHGHLQVDGGLRPGLAGETDVEGVVAELIPSQALVGPVVTVEDGLDGQSGLPGAVADLEMIILMIYKQQIFQLLWLLVSSQKYHFKVDHLSSSQPYTFLVSPLLFQIYLSASACLPALLQKMLTLG